MKKVLLVTGASSDIGRSYISEYANRYDKIVGTYYTNRDCLEELQKDLGDKLEIYPLNLLDEDTVDRFCDFDGTGAFAGIYASSSGAEN